MSYQLSIDRLQQVYWGFTTRFDPRFVRSSAEFAQAKVPVGPDPLERTVSAIQVHSKKIRLIDRRHVLKASSACISFNNTDGLITSLMNLRLVILSADCLPVFIIAPHQTAAIALLHAGWKGSRQQIAAEGIRKLKRFSKQPASRFRVFFGPCLRKCCYEVGDEFRRFFPLSTRRPRNKTKWHFDLIAENKRQLIEEGVHPSRITDSGICTSCQNQLFYSYRKEKEAAGRLISWIVKKSTQTL